jgi:uncharacterized iron-regulated membrane protein
LKRFKKAILFIHRWLGLLSGLVVFIVSITGCIFCFQDELQDAIHDWRRVEVRQNGSYLPPSRLKQIALAQFPGSSANFLYYFGEGRPAMVLVNAAKRELMDVYLDPYTAQITHIENARTNFFTVVEYIHLYLLLPAHAGTLVVGTSVIVFILMMITGIILWWPKRKCDRKRSFRIKWNGRWRRVNYDLHNVLGFYATGIALLLALTGLSMAFNWVHEGIYSAANLGKSYPAEKQVHRSDTLSAARAAENPADRSFIFARQHSPDAQMFLLGMDSRKAGVISITAYARTLQYGHSDFYYFDQYSGKLLGTLPYKGKSAGMKLNDLNYDLHVGQALGLSGKIMAFLASLICASLPVTGLIVWIGKRRKSKKQTVSSSLRRHKLRKLPGES